MVTWLLAAALVALSVDVRQEGALARLERRLWRRPGPAPSWLAQASRIGDDRLLGLALSAVVSRRALRGRDVALPALWVGGGVVWRRALSVLVRRQRPPQAWWQEEPTGWSYPSRHTTNAILLAVLLAGGCDRADPPRVTAAAVAVATVVGSSRVGLGVHWPSDVVGAGLLCAVWVWVARRLVSSCRRDTPFRGHHSPR